MLKKLSVVICAAAVFVMTAGTAIAQGDAVADAATTAAVKTKLLADTKVAGLGIDVDTKDNVVTLSGKVRSAAERDEALRLARTTTGVKSVVDRLVVDPNYRGVTTKDDRAKAEVKDEAKDAKAKAKATTGKAGDAAERTGQATKDAANKAGDAAADAAITGAVKSKLLADTKVGGLKIDVDTSNNVVTLTGKVGTVAERNEALRLARTTTGVKRVVNKLVIDKAIGTTGRTDTDDKLKVEIKDDTKESAAKVKDATKKGAEKTKDVAQDAADKTKDAARKTMDVTADASITAAVKTKLLADTAVRGLKIDVDTKDNVVTLTGTVRSAAERDEALRLARTTTGVKSVVDKLVIQP